MAPIANIEASNQLKTYRYVISKGGILSCAVGQNSVINKVVSKQVKLLTDLDYQLDCRHMDYHPRRLQHWQKDGLCVPVMRRLPFQLLQACSSPLSYVTCQTAGGSIGEFVFLIVLCACEYHACYACSRHHWGTSSACCTLQCSCRPERELQACMVVSNPADG